MDLQHKNISDDLVPSGLRLFAKTLSTESLIILVIGLSDLGQRKLSVEEISLACWEINPEKHSLRGYPQYPDSFVVIKRIFDMKGRKGLLSGSVASGFRLTALSKARFDELFSEADTKQPRTSARRIKEDRTITSIDQAPYRRLQNTPAYRKFQNGERDRIVESDFLYFYGISWSSSKAQIDGKIKNVDAIVSKFAEKDSMLVELKEFLDSKFGKLKESL